MPDATRKELKIGLHRQHDSKPDKKPISEQLEALGGMEGQVGTALSSFSPDMSDAKKKGGFFHKVGSAIAAPVQSMKRKHERAADQLNNSREDFKTMSRWDRFKWAAENPLAYTFASKEKEGTVTRNARNAELQQRVEAGRQTSKPTAAQEEYQRQLEQYRKPQSEELSEDIDEAWGYESKAAEGVGKLAEQAGDYGEAASESMGGTMSLITGGKEVYDRIKEARAAGASGNRTKQITKGMDAGQSLLTTLANGAEASLNVASKFQGLSGLSGVAEQFAPGVDVLSGGVKAGKGVVNMVDSTKTRMNMSKQLEELQASRGDVSGETGQIMRQIRSQSKIDQTGAGFDIATGSLQAAGGILNLSGVGAAAATALKGTAQAGDFVKGQVTKKMGKNMRHQVLNEAFDLDGKIEALKTQYPDLSDREAKHVALQQMGFSTGKRKEAFQHLTMGRAAGLTGSATTETPEGVRSRRIIEGTGLRKGKNGQYDLQSVSEKLGMDKEKSWQEQMQEVAESRTANPFAEKAAAERRAKAAAQLAKQKKKGEASA